MTGTPCAAIVLGLILLSGGINGAIGQDARESVEVSAALSFVPHSDGVAARTISPALRAVYPFGSKLEVSAEWGVTYVSLERIGFDSDRRVDVGNPLVGLLYRISSQPSWLDCSLGFQAGIPLAVFPGNIPDNRLAEFNYNNANSAYGWRNPFLWMMNVVPTIIDANVNGMISHRLLWDLTVKPSYLISVNSRPSRFAFSGLLGFDFAVAGAHLRGGASWFYSSLALENNDHDQCSAWLGTGFGALAGQIHIDANLNLDGPNGFASHSPKPTWGIVLRYKWQIE